MKFSDGALMATRDIKARKLRSTLTVIAIAIGCMLLVLTDCMGNNITKEVNGMILNVENKNQVIVSPIKYTTKSSPAEEAEMQMQSGQQELPYNPKESYDPKLKSNVKNIDDADLSKMDSLKSVTGLWAYNIYSIPKVSIEGVKKDGTNPIIIGNAKGYHYEVNGEIIAGTGLNGNKSDIIVSESFLKKLGISDYSSVVGKKINLIANKTGEKDFDFTGKIIGVYKSSEYNIDGDIMTMDEVRMDFMSYVEGRKVQDLKEYYGAVVLDGASDNIVNAVKYEVNNKLGYEATTVQSSLKVLDGLTGTLKSILNVGAIIIIIVAGVGLVNTMAMSMQEQKKWIAIMRSVGATSRNIKTIFLTQGLLLGVIGGILGCFLAGISVFGTNIYLSSAGQNFRIAFGGKDLITGFLITFVIALFSGLIVTMRIRKMNLTNALNEE